MVRGSISALKEDQLKVEEILPEDKVLQ